MALGTGTRHPDAASQPQGHRQLAYLTVRALHHPLPPVRPDGVWPRFHAGRGAAPGRHAGALGLLRRGAREAHRAAPAGHRDAACPCGAHTTWAGRPRSPPPPWSSSDCPARLPRCCSPPARRSCCCGSPSVRALQQLDPLLPGGVSGRRPAPGARHRAAGRLLRHRPVPGEPARLDLLLPRPRLLLLSRCRSGSRRRGRAPAQRGGTALLPAAASAVPAPAVVFVRYGPRHVSHYSLIQNPPDYDTAPGSCTIAGRRMGTLSQLVDGAPTCTTRSVAQSRHCPGNRWRHGERRQAPQSESTGTG